MNVIYMYVYVSVVDLAMYRPICQNAKIGKVSKNTAIKRQSHRADLLARVRKGEWKFINNLK